MRNKTLAKITHTSDLEPNEQVLTNTYFILSVIPAFFYSISTTFISLFAIDLVGFGGAGIIFSIFFFINAVADYPTGLLSDLIGHNKVLFLAYTFFSVSYLGLYLANSFWTLVIAFIFQGLAQAQISGTLVSWFDTNYKLSVASDPDQVVYRDFNGQMNKYRELIGGFGIITGGSFATFLPTGRRIVFGIQAVATLILAFIFLKYVTRVHLDSKETTTSYFQKVLQSLRFVKGSKTSLFLFSGEIINIAYGTTYYWLFLFPIYFGYTGSDFLAGIYRFILFVIGAFLFGYVGQVSKKLEVKQGFEKYAIVGVVIMHPLLLFVLITFPLANQFEAIPVIIIFFALTTSNFLLRVAFSLVDKFKVTYVPDEIRNSIYSFTPTFGLLLAIPISTLIGLTITAYSITQGYVILILLDVISIVLIRMALHMS